MTNHNTTSLKKAILNELEREFVLKKGTLKDNESLNQFTWDSLSVVMLITMLSKDFNIDVDPIEITSAETVQDLVNIANSKLKL